MPVINKTRAQFLVLPLPAWFPVAPWPIPLTSGHIQDVLDHLEEFVLSNSAWEAIKTIILSMPSSSFEEAADIADVIEDYCDLADLSPWVVEEPQ